MTLVALVRQIILVMELLVLMWDLMSKCTILNELVIQCTSWPEADRPILLKLLVIFKIARSQCAIYMEKARQLFVNYSQFSTVQWFVWWFQLNFHIVVELLPSEIKARLVQIQKLDEKIQGIVKLSLITATFFSCNAILGQLESLSDRTKTFFTLSRKNKQDWREHQYQSLVQVLFSIAYMVLSTLYRNTKNVCQNPLRRWNYQLICVNW